VDLEKFCDSLPLSEVSIFIDGKFLLFSSTDILSTKAQALLARSVTVFAANLLSSLSTKSKLKTDGASPWTYALIADIAVIL